MKTVTGFLVTLVFSILNRPYLLMAQDEGMNIDSLAVQDSSYMEGDIFTGAVAQSSGSGTTVIIIVVVLVVIAVVAYFILKKKKK